MREGEREPQQCAGFQRRRFVAAAAAAPLLPPPPPSPAFSSLWPCPDGRSIRFSDFDFQQQQQPTSNWPTRRVCMCAARHLFAL